MTKYIWKVIIDSKIKKKILKEFASKVDTKYSSKGMSINKAELKKQANQKFKEEFNNFRNELPSAKLKKVGKGAEISFISKFKSKTKLRDQLKKISKIFGENVKLESVGIFNEDKYKKIQARLKETAGLDWSIKRIAESTDEAVNLIKKAREEAGKREKLEERADKLESTVREVASERDKLLTEKQKLEEEKEELESEKSEIESKLKDIKDEKELLEGMLKAEQAKKEELEKEKDKIRERLKKEKDLSKKEKETLKKQLKEKNEAMEETKNKMRKIFKQANELEDKEKEVEKKKTQVKEEEKKVEKKEEKIEKEEEIREKKAEKELSTFKPKEGRAYLIVETELSTYSLKKFARIVSGGYKGFCFSGSPKEYLFEEERAGSELEAVEEDIDFYWISSSEVKPEKGILTYEFGEILEDAEDDTIIFVELDKLIENTDVDYVLKEIKVNSEKVVGKPCILLFFVSQNPKHPDKEKAEFIAKANSFIKVKSIDY